MIKIPYLQNSLWWKPIFLMVFGLPGVIYYHFFDLSTFFLKENQPHFGRHFDKSQFFGKFIRNLLQEQNMRNQTPKKHLPHTALPKTNKKPSGRAVVFGPQVFHQNPGSLLYAGMKW